MIKLLRFILPTLLVLGLFMACESAEEKGMTPDQKIVYRGVQTWNNKGPDSAQAIWAKISDVPTRTKYTGYVAQHAAFVKELEAVSAIKPDEDTKLSPAYEKMMKGWSNVPPELKLPTAERNRVLTLAADSVRERIKDGKLNGAQDLLKASVDTFGDSADLTSLKIELDVLLASKQRENDADAVLNGARAEEDFSAKIQKYQDATAVYVKCENALADAAKSAKVSDKPSIVSAQTKLKRKRQDSKIEMDRRLRERAYSFKDRIGEEFARVPEGDQLGHMTLDDLLKFQQEIRTNVEAEQKDLLAFAAKFPAVIDKDMLNDVDQQKRDLNDRISQVEQEIRTAKDIASRGKAILPLMIGLFNPQPGGTAKDQKSRPGVFRGETHKNPEYWWGMISIPKGTLNDLVISVNDNRPVRVFADNTLSGTKIGKNGLTDLVNRSYKVGNVWPVLNAGNQLNTGKYYIELQSGKSPSYAGEAVIYSSFVMRTR